MLEKDAICSAIRANKLVLLKCSDGRARLVEPYAFGRNSKGADLVRVYQLRPAVGETIGWKLMRAADIEAMRVLAQEFEVRSDYQRHDEALDGMIYCQR